MPEWKTRMVSVANVAAGWTYGSALQTRQPEQAQPAPRVATPTFDSFDATEQDFDFEAGRQASAAAIRRDELQLLLSEVADKAASSGLTDDAAIAAYREFEK